MTARRARGMGVLAGASLLAANLGACRAPRAGGTGPLPSEATIYAAVSLRESLLDLEAVCEGELGIRLVFNFGASSDLARQITAAAKADVFVSADEDWMDAVERAGLIVPGTRRSLLSNRLVVVVPADRPPEVRGPADLAAPGVRRVAIADPAIVPAGKYARGWLEHAGTWAGLKDRVVPALDVRAALAAVEAGAVDAGVVYRTDAAVSRRARIVYEVPEDQGPAVSYTIAALRGPAGADLARRLCDCIAGPAGLDAFRRRGFLLPEPER